MKSHSHNWSKFSTLFTLYIAQSIPMSFFSTVVPIIMRQENYSLVSIGMLQLVKLPWIFKFLWAPLVDNNTRNKKQIRSWIVISELVYAGIIVSVSFFDLQTDFKLIVGFIVAAFVASATQDIATDIFAIFILGKKERGTGNGIQVSGSFIGSLFGTGVLVIAFYYLGWSAILISLAVFAVIALIPLMVYKSEVKVEKNDRIRFIEIFTFFRNKVLRRRILFLVTYNAGIIGILAMLKPYLVDLGYSTKEIGFMYGVIGTSCAAIVSLVMGHSLRYIGKMKAIYIFSFIALLAPLYFLYLSKIEPSNLMVYIGICLIWATYGMLAVVLYTTSMDTVRKDREGTDFTIQIMLSQLSSMFVAILSGKVGDVLGYSGIHIFEIGLCCIAIAVVFYVYPLRKIKNENR